MALTTARQEKILGGFSFAAYACLLHRLQCGRMILCIQVEEAASMHDIVIRGGTIIDGSGTAAFTGDLAIEDTRIAAVGGRLPCSARDRR